MDIAAIARSGMQSAERRLFASAHNVANLQTSDFHRLAARQVATPGGSAVYLEREATARPVGLLEELTAQRLASHQFRVSLQVLGVADALHGATVDLLA